ncbi:hypothetical protein HDU76_000888, partial [Blyttiomyces sp. JEL0837]
MVAKDETAGPGLPFVLTQSAKVVRSRFSFLITTTLITVVLVTVGIIAAREDGIMRKLADAMEHIKKRPAVTTDLVSLNDPPMNELVACMSKAPTYAASQLCWSKFRRAKVLEMIERMEQQKFEDVKRFQSDQEYEFFQMLIPTHECDTLKLQ